MGQGPSQPTPPSADQISDQLVRRCADRCLTPLELLQFKENFRQRALEQDGISYWTETTFAGFLRLPLMSSGQQNHDIGLEGVGDVVFQMVTHLGAFPFAASQAPCILNIGALIKAVVLLTSRYRDVIHTDKGWNRLLFDSLAVLEPQGYENRNDDLALAALQALEARELYETPSHQPAIIPTEHFRKLIHLMLLLGTPGACPGNESAAEWESVTDCILWAFEPEDHAGISYALFDRVLNQSLPFLFHGFRPLFDRFLFTAAITPAPSKFLDSEILCLSRQCQLGLLIRLDHLRPLYIAADAGFSMQSIEHGVVNWQAPTVLLVAGTLLSDSAVGTRVNAFREQYPSRHAASGPKGNQNEDRVLYGAYIDSPWKHSAKEAVGGPDCLLFQLAPVHHVFRANSLNTGCLNFTKSGIFVGSAAGSVSLLLEENLEFGRFNHEPQGGGAFLPGSEKDWQDCFEVDGIEIWGVGGTQEAQRQEAAWAFEQREAAARMGLKRSQDIESDRALLEMAGLVGNHNASGGSMA